MKYSLTLSNDRHTIGLAWKGCVEVEEVVHQEAALAFLDFRTRIHLIYFAIFLVTRTRLPIFLVAVSVVDAVEEDPALPVASVEACLGELRSLVLAAWAV